MTVKHLGESYDFPSANRVEGYGGDINFYIRWERHMLFACPSAYRAPVDMSWRDFCEGLARPDYAAHPDAAKLDFEACEWVKDDEPWQPEFDKSLKENGVDHMCYVSFRSPGLEGMLGCGY
ncbi:MAG: phenol hydroxylase subunit P4 [Gammaproteobacteria bacterium]